MDSRLLKMTENEQKQYKAYNDILAACMDDFKSNIELQKMGIRYIENTITYKCKHLVKTGYLEMQRQTKGHLRLVYKTLKPVYPLDMFIDTCNAKKTSQRNTRVAKIEQKPVHREPTLGARKIDFNELEAKQAETARLDRLNRKAPKVYAGHWGYQNG